MAAHLGPKDFVPVWASVTNLMLLVLSVSKILDTVGMERSHQRLMRRERPNYHVAEQDLHAKALSSAVHLSQGQRQNSQVTLKSFGAVVANLTPVGIAYTRATNSVEAPSRRAPVPPEVNQYKQVQGGPINSQSPLDELLHNIPAASFVIDSSGIDPSPSRVNLAENHQVPASPSAYATATQPPLVTLTLTAVQQAVPTIAPPIGPTSSVPAAAPPPGQTQAQAAPTPAPDSNGDGGGWIFFFVMLVLVGGALVAVAFAVRLKMQSAGGLGTGSTRLGDDSSFWRSAKHRQSARKTLLLDDLSQDDDDTSKQKPLPSPGVRSMLLSPNGRSRNRPESASEDSGKLQIRNPPPPDGDNSDVLEATGGASSTSNANYRRRDRPVRGLSSRSVSAGPESRNMEDLEDRGSSKESPLSPSKRRSQSSRSRRGQQVSRTRSTAECDVNNDLVDGDNMVV